MVNTIMIEKKEYESPELFVESFLCDRGFEASSGEYYISDGEDDEFETI